MNVEIVTKDDLKSLKDDIVSEMKSLLKGNTENRQWLKSADVCKLLQCSQGTLQNLRINGTLPYTRVGGTLYYSLEEVNKLLEKNKKNTP